MKIFDISQEVLSCHVYPGDPAPQRQQSHSIANGSLYNLSEISMGAHNGTHVDAPAHFLLHGKTIDQLPLEAFVGNCFVVHCHKDLTANDAREILQRAAQAGAAERILLAGGSFVTAEAANVFAASGVQLLGTENQSIAPDKAPAEVHRILLEAQIVLLEGIVLKNIAEGVYFLSAAPLNFSGIEGSPCRAYLIAHT